MIASLLTLAKLRLDVADLLNPAICTKASASGAELNVTVIVFAVVEVEYAVVSHLQYWN